MAKIMLVEDDNNLREIYGARLQAEGHEIVAAKDGEEALALAVKEKPELIISDVMMPRISGFDMLDILRNAPETKDTKVIMMTALSQAEDKARADKLGADRYLVKSQVTLEDVAHVVRDVLEGKPESSEASAPDTDQPAPLPVNDTPQSDVAVPPSAPPEPAPSVEAIANPVVEVHDEPNPSQIQAPPAEEPQPESATETTAPATEPSTPTAAPAAALPAADDASTDDPAAVTSSAATDDDTATEDPVPAPPAAEPAPLKVELPQTSSEPTVETPASTQNNSTEDSKDSTFVGPTLAEALASEESTPSQPEKSEATPETDTPSQPEAAQPAPEESSPAANDDPDKASENDTGVTSGSSASAAAGMRVIQPINDPTAKPDINKLLDDEERKAAVENPTANTVITPEKKDGNDSANNIAL